MLESKQGIFLIFLPLLFPNISFAQTQSRRSEHQRYVAKADDVEIPGFPFQRHFTTDKYDRTITFYLSMKKSEEKLPLAVCIQGSGSQSVFLEYQGQIASGGPESIVLRDFGDRVRVLVVEKPGVEFLSQPSRPGSSLEGTAEFNREFTLPRWTEAINAATKASLKLDNVDTSKVLALGHSEGGQLACTLAAVNPAITHVAVMAGGGPTQMFDFIEFARQGVMYDPDQTAEERIAALLTDWQKVLADPDAADKFILGHSHRRWSSFAKVSSIDAIARSKAKVFIAQGTADMNSLPASSDVLYAELLTRGRDVTYERIPDADHGFMTADDTQGQGWTSTNGKAIEWFLQ